MAVTVSACTSTHTLQSVRQRMQETCVVVNVHAMGCKDCVHTRQQVVGAAEEKIRAHAVHCFVDKLVAHIVCIQRVCAYHLVVQTLRHTRGRRRQQAKHALRRLGAEEQRCGDEAGERARVCQGETWISFSDMDGVLVIQKC